MSQSGKNRITGKPTQRSSISGEQFEKLKMTFLVYSFCTTDLHLPVCHTACQYPRVAAGFSHFFAPLSLNIDLLWSATLPLLLPNSPIYIAS